MTDYKVIRHILEYTTKPSKMQTGEQGTAEFLQVQPQI